MQSDPIGLAAGVNTFGYVSGKPLTRYDFFGLMGNKAPDPVKDIIKNEVQSGAGKQGSEWSSSNDLPSLCSGFCAVSEGLYGPKKTNCDANCIIDPPKKVQDAYDKNNKKEKTPEEKRQEELDNWWKDLKKGYDDERKKDKQSKNDSGMCGFA